MGKERFILVFFPWNGSVRRIVLPELSAMHNYRELVVWQKSMDFVKEVCQVATSFPATERFGLAQQIRRSSISIPSNISEGAGRSGKKEFQYFIGVSIGSCNEVQTQLEISFRLGYISEALLNKLLEKALEINKMLVALHKSMDKPTVKP